MSAFRESSPAALLLSQMLPSPSTTNRTSGALIKYGIYGVIAVRANVKPKDSMMALRGGNRGAGWVRWCGALELWGFERRAWLAGAWRARSAEQPGVAGGRDRPVGRPPARVEGPGSRHEPITRCRVWPGSSAPGRCAPTPTGRTSVGRSHERSHHVSIRIATVGGGGARGAPPGAKVSMMTMRPPQHGQGCASTGGSSRSAT